jgi:hypothetical protein
MYLDTNGDGVNNSSDHLNATGSTTIDVWINTNHNRSGATVTCSDGSSALTINSYEFILQASGGTISWGSYTNNQATMSTNFGTATSTTDYHNGFGGSTVLSPGLYKLGSLTVSIATGSPAIHIVGATILSSIYQTEFASQCPGLNFDNTLALGHDWFDTGDITTTAGTLVPSIPAIAGTFLSFDTGLKPDGVASADLNADGRPDLVLADRDANRVSVLLGEGDGSYRTWNAKVDYITGNSPMGVVLADFNNDGNKDIATVNGSSNTVSILLGNGDGTFGSKTDFTVGSSPKGIAAADFDGDGKVDLATANYGANTVSVLKGNGDGTFATAGTYATGSFPTGIAAGDVIPGGGTADIVVTNAGSNTVSIFPDSSNGSLGPRKDFAVGTYPVAVVIADLNPGATHWMDLAVANYTSNSVSVLLGTGDSTVFSAKTDFSCGGNALAIAAGDFNGDSHRDIVVTADTGWSAFLLLGDGNGGFGTPSTIATAEDPSAVLAADLNGDSRTDLAIANLDAATVSIHLCNGNGTFGGATTADAGTNQGNQHIALGDLNGDGKLDAVVAHYASNSVALLLGNGNGTFGARTDISIGYTTSFSAIADVNNDGKQDLLVSDFVVNKVWVLLGNGNGTFGTPTGYYMNGLQPGCISLKDLNADGKLDMAVATGGEISILLGTGGGAFGSRTGYTCASDPRWVIAKDVNGDGIPDIVATSYSANEVSVFPGNGNGTFGSRTDYGAGTHPRALDVGDINGDGKPDIVAVNDGSSTISILLNTGSGFGSPSSISVGTGAVSVALADMNGDGKLDIVTGNSAPVNTVSVLLGAGDGTFPTRRDFGAGVNPAWMAVGNIDAGTLPDIVVANINYEETVTALPNHASVTEVESIPIRTRTLLAQNYPNPFNPSTVIEYSLPHASFVRLQVFDVQGRQVASLVKGSSPSGLNRVRWLGRNDRGNPVASGVYLYRLEVDGRTYSRRMVLAR